MKVLERSGCWLAAAALTVALASGGCATSGGGGTGEADEGDVNTNGSTQQEDNQDAGTDDGSTETRSDGARLLYRPDNPQASAQNVAFSPDGSRIVFTVFENGYNKGPAGLWVASADGSDARRITPEEDQDNVNVPGGAWNAVSDEIVFASDRAESDDIWAIHPDGTGLRRITAHLSPPYWIEPVWSPNGDWIVFEADTEAATELEQRGTIFKVRADGTDLTQLTKRDGEDLDDHLPNWSPDGDRILFQRRLPGDEDTGGDNWDVYVIDTDGDGLLNVSDARELFNTDNSWAPSGEWIASSSAFQESGEELPHPNIIAFFVTDPDSDEAADAPVRITSSDRHEDGAPSVSPNGQWVALESHRTEDEDSPSDIWIIRAPDVLLPDRA